MAGLAKICKLYGKMTTKDAKGNTLEWLYDYALDKPRLKSEMSKQEISDSNKAKKLLK